MANKKSSSPRVGDARLERRLLSRLDESSDLDGLDECIAYARTRRHGDWPDLETQLWMHAEDYDDCEPWVRYVVQAKRQRSPDLERRLLANTDNCDAFVAYLNGGLVTPRWLDAEPYLLQCATFDLDAMSCAVKHAHTHFHGHWQALENSVVQGQCHPLPAVEYAIQSGKRHWTPLEGLLLGSSATRERVLALIRYTAVCVGTRWDPAEQYILAIPHPPRRRNAIVWYARDVAKGRWEEAEDELAMSPRHLYGYAKEVMKGRLPEGLHEKMVMHGFLNDRFGKMYVERYAQKP